MLDTDPSVTAEDAAALEGWLASRGVLNSSDDTIRNCAIDATPLSAVEVVTAPCAGLFLASVPPGRHVKAGTAIGTLRRLPDGAEIALHTTSEGVLYAREQVRIVRAGAELFFVAGKSPRRKGMLLSA